MLTQERVKHLFTYSDGNLFRRVSTKGFNAGVLVGCVGKNGYKVTTVDGRKTYVHRIIFLYHHGYSPENEIDHLDRNRTNNRIENLREVSKMCNSRNASMKSNNSSWVTGVSWDSQRGKWYSCIQINHHSISLGRNTDFVEAVAHRLAAEQAENWEGCNSTSPAYQFMQRYLKPHQELEDL